MPRAHKLIINWGSSKLNPDWHEVHHIWNKVPNVRIAANKLSSFEAFQTAGIEAAPAFTTSYDQAVAWTNEGKVVVCRTQLNGHSGAGIHLAARPEDVVQNCPLFVLYKKKKREYRVHVAFGRVIDVQQKKKRSDYAGTVDFAIRNHHTGWVYCREGVELPQVAEQLAIRSVDAVGLDFGAVDIIYNEHEDAYYVLEINTAPGLEGQTVEKYAAAFAEKVRTYE